MEIFSGTTAIILGVVLLFYFVISCGIILKGSESVYSSPEEKKKVKD